MANNTIRPNRNPVDVRGVNVRQEPPKSRTRPQAPAKPNSGVTFTGPPPKPTVTSISDFGGPPRSKPNPGVGFTGPAPRPNAKPFDVAGHAPRW